MKQPMQNRIIAFLLALLMVFGDIAMPVYSVESETQPAADDYSQYVGYFAVVNTDEENFVQMLESAPSEGWSSAAYGFFPEEFAEDMLLRIDAYTIYTDYEIVTDETTGEETGRREINSLWYQVTVIGGTAPEGFADSCWVFQNYITEGDAYDVDALILSPAEDHVYCEICGKYDCGMDHTDDVLTDATTGVSVTGDLPKGAVLEVIDYTGTYDGVYDIKIYLEDGVTEWQPIDEGKTVTISIPVEGVEDGDYVDVYHFVDYAKAFSNSGVQYVSTESISTEGRSELTTAIQNSDKAGYVPVEFFEKVCIVEGFVQIEANSFSLYQYDGSNYVKQDVELVDGRLVVTFNSDYNSSEDNPAYNDVTQYFYASPEQLFKLRTSNSQVGEGTKNPYSIIEKPSDAVDEESTSTQVLNNPSAYLVNLDEKKEADAWVDGWRTRHAYLNIVGLLPGDVIWLQCTTRSVFSSTTRTTYMKVVVVDEVNITFDKNLASATLQNTTYGPVPTDGDSSKNLFTIPTATGYIPKSSDPRYIFTGWNTSPAGDGTSYTYNSATGTFSPAAFTPMRDMTLYAMWDADNYVVNFDANGGAESYDPVTVDKGGTITLPAAPTRTDYTFIGWSATTDGYSTIYPAGREFTVNQDTTLYALWAVNLTITILGGDLTLQLEDEFSSTPLDERYYATSGNKMFEKTENPDGSVTYTASPIEGFFKNARFTFFYDTDKQKSPTYSSTGTSVAFSGSSGQLFATLPSTGMDANTTITITAPEKGSISYTVSYETNYGSPVAATVLTGLEGDTLSLTALPAEGATTRNGYSLEGWYLDSSLTQKATVPMTIAANTILYAKWTANEYTYNVVYKSSTGVELGSTTVTKKFGTTNTISAPVYTGYTTPASQSVTWDSAVAKTITFTYEPIQYTITYDGLEGATVSGNPTSYTVESNAITLNKPTKEGHTFAGWTGTGLSGATVDVTISAGSTGDRSYIATWTANQYTVTFNANDGTGTMNGQDFTYDVAQNLTANAFTRTGYTFNGWNTAKDGSGTSYADKASVKNLTATADGKVTLYAQWTINTYTVTWKNEDGTVLETDENVPYGTTPSYDGTTPNKAADAQYTYTFAGWNPEIVAVTGPTTYTATYTETVNTYTVTWKNADGTVLETDENVPYGTMPAYDGATPTKAATAQYSYTFDKWSPAVSAVTGDVIYTATYTETVNTYTVTWKNADGTVLETDENVPYGTTPTYDGTTPTKAADAQYTYTFAGWSPAVVEVTGDATYTAQFDSTVNQYTITWVDGNGDTLKIEQVAYGETPAYTGATPTKTATAQYSYTFAGWSPTVSAVTGDATYTAQFDSTVNKYTITFANTGDTVIAPITQDYGTAVTPPADPTKTGYTFAGWDKEIPATMPAENMTITAKWTINQYTITFDADGGSAVAPITQDYGTAVTAPADPTKPGYIFVGWDKDIPTTMPAEDITITAKWEVATTTLTISVNGGTGTFIFRLTDGNGLDMLVTVQGGGSVTITGLLIGTNCTVTDMGWNWRYNSMNSKSIELKQDAAQNVVTFTPGLNDPGWLGGEG